MPKVQRLKVKEGPVHVDTSFISDSPQGRGAFYVNETGDPRGCIAIALQLFSSCGAAQQGATLEEVETLNTRIQEIADRYKDLSRSMVGQTIPPSSPALKTTPKKDIFAIKTLEDEEL